jgi:hypothetical protein
MPAAYANLHSAPAELVLKPALQKAAPVIRAAEHVAVGVGTGVGFVLTCFIPVAGPVICKVVGGIALAGLFTSGQPTLVALDQQVGSCVKSHYAYDPDQCAETIGAGVTMVVPVGLEARALLQRRALLRGLRVGGERLGMEGEQLSFEFVETLPGRQGSTRVSKSGAGRLYLAWSQSKAGTG